MPHDFANRQMRLAVGPELRPILGNRRVVVDQPPVDESVDDGRGHPLGCREDHRRGIGRPRHCAAPVRPAGPYVDDGLAVEVDRQGPATESAAGEQARKPANDTREVWVEQTRHTMTRVRGIA